MTRSIRTSMGVHARWYAARGWLVLPLWWPAGPGRCACGGGDCASIGKHPIAALVPNGLRQATTDPQVISSWWSAYSRANIGIRTGAESGLVVLDVDVKHGRANAQVARLADRYGPIGAVWVRTGSGGAHGYLAHPSGTVPNSAGRLGPGIDVRGDGGYVVAPPSLHASGRRYQWLRPVVSELRPVPPTLLEAVRPSARGASAPVRLDRTRVSAYVAAAIEGEAREVSGATKGVRNHRLNLAAYRLGQLVGAGLVSENTVREALHISAESAGLGRREANATIRSGLVAGIKQLRALDIASARGAGAPTAGQQGLRGFASER